MNKVILISREFGSGGHSIGKEIAEKLGIPFYDEEIVLKVAEESGFTADFIKDCGEYMSNSNRFFSGASFVPTTSIDLPPEKIFSIQAKIIKEIASKGPSVIVGRCADYILEDEDVDTFTVFIHADKESRKKRVLQRYGETKISLEKRLHQKDKQRKAYYRYFTDREWGDYHNYNLALDSGSLGEEKCVDLIISAIK